MEDLDSTHAVLDERDGDEYGAVKREQDRRRDRRDNYAYATGAVALTTIVGALQVHSPVPLAVLPYATFVLGWKATANDLKVSELGRYVSCLARRIRARLRRSAAYRGLPEPLQLEVDADIARIFGWEQHHSADQVAAAQRQYMHKLADTVLFLAPGYAAPLAVLAYLIVGTDRPAGITATVIVLASVYLTVMLTRTVLGGYARQRTQGTEAQS